MSVLSEEVTDYLKHSSMIRKMFEAGIELKKKYGDDRVYDFSLGNPDLPPPPQIKQALLKLADRADKPFAFGYMPNAGYPEMREKQAAQLGIEQKTAVPASNVVMTCGAAGGINALFRAVLSPGDEVMVPAPFFLEYRFYAENFGAKLKPVPADPADFSLDLEAMEQAFSPAVRAVLINSPHNPTGRIYTRKELGELAFLMSKMERKYGRPIYLVADEPYRFLNFDGVEIPSLFELYEHSVVIGSYSKNLSLAGERIGFVAVNPAMQEAAELVAGVILTNRILGFVNAPAIAQLLVMEAIGAQADLDVYRRRRAAMGKVLDAAGIRYFMPQGAFYFFPESPVENESEFVAALLKERVLSVPGSGFGAKGYFRLAFCVSERIIENSAPSFLAAMEKIRR